MEPRGESGSLRWEFRGRHLKQVARKTLTEWANLNKALENREWPTCIFGKGVVF